MATVLYFHRQGCPWCAVVNEFWPNMRVTGVRLESVDVSSDQATLAYYRNWLIRPDGRVTFPSFLYLAKSGHVIKFDCPEQPRTQASLTNQILRLKASLT